MNGKSELHILVRFLFWDLGPLISLYAAPELRQTPNQEQIRLNNLDKSPMSSCES